MSSWNGSTAVARPVGPGFFPLDEEFGLLPGNLTPRLQEALVRLSTHIPSFAKAARELTWFTGAQVHPDTARARTEAAGAVLVAYETAEATRHPAMIIRRRPARPTRLILSVDGAMIPLVHGQWTEVRTLAVGEVQPPQASRAGPVVHTTNLSYFSRRTDSTTFGDLATLELHRRGIEGARRVGAVVDGAVWCQSFVDLHYPEAVRILDFAHAAEYLTAIAQTSGADGPLLSPAQLVELRHALKHDGPAAVLPQLARTRGHTAGQRRAGQPAGLSGNTGGAVAVPAVCRGGLADWQRDGRERQQTGGRRPAERRGHALGRCERQSDAGLAQCRV